MFISTAWAQAAGAEGGAGGLLGFLPLILIFVIFYFLLIRPQQKKQKQHQTKIAAVRRGDKVLTGGGIFGTVTKVIDDNELEVEIGKDMKVKVAKAMLADVLSKTEPASGGAAANDAGEKKGGLLASLMGGGAKPADAGKDAGGKPGKDTGKDTGEGTDQDAQDAKDSKS